MKGIRIVQGASIEWAFARDNVRAWGFVKGYLCYTIRHPGTAMVNKKDDPPGNYILELLLDNGMPFGYKTQAEAIKSAEADLGIKWGKRVSAPLWSRPAPFGKIDIGDAIFNARWPHLARLSRWLPSL